MEIIFRFMLWLLGEVLFDKILKITGVERAEKRAKRIKLAK